MAATAAVTATTFTVVVTMVVAVATAAAVMAVIVVMVVTVRTVNVAMSQLFFEHVHGKAASVPVAATAFPHRGEGFNTLIISQWAEAADTERGRRWASDTNAAMSRFYKPGRYMNYQSDEGPDVVAAAYGQNYARLREAKSKYDPENVFHLNLNILPMGWAVSS